jgi:FAD:protein FMN transferase
VPLLEALPLGPDRAQWDVWGTVARIVVTDPECLDAATDLVRAELAEVDATCSRFRSDSEIEQVFRARGRPVRVSARLAELVTAAMAAAEATDGDVDPTMGSALAALGYDRDFASIDPQVAGAARVVIYPGTSWRDVRLDGDLLTAPEGIRFDLGSIGKAWAADRCSKIVAEQCHTGVLVALGGDIATAGDAPDGWDILVQDGPDQPPCTVELPDGGALATSSTISRRWRRGDQMLHHILDPATGDPAPVVWRTASVVSFSCVDANTLSTATLVRGSRARSMLRALDVPARLVTIDGSVETYGGWPAEAPVRTSR